ncbi:MAG: LPXTG cell wall anchor domain-containing protein [Burkholderiaceae bacterium]|nr:MAG: LPXTG cell wall anchor domain-containing protein [Burkholderiaceae bacterium]
MQREKLFLSTIFLILCLLSSLASFPILFIVISDAKQAASIGAAIFFSLPIVSLALLWLAKTDNAYLLRRRSFLIWGIITGLLGIGNIILPKTGGNDWGSLVAVGFALLAMTVYEKKKEEKRRAQQSAK